MRHEVPDSDGRVLQFAGELIAEATSYEPGKERWAELKIYRTEQGSFVLAGVGRSVVRGETDRTWASLIDDAAGVIARLTLIDGNSVHYIPHVNRQAIMAAGETCREIREAYAVQQVA